MEREYAYGNAANLEMSFGNEFLLGSINFYYFAFFGFTVEMSDSTPKTPRDENVLMTLLCQI